MRCFWVQIAVFIFSVQTSLAQVFFRPWNESSNPVWCKNEPQAEVLNQQILSIEEATRGVPPPCPETIIGKKVLFTFEGAGGYSPAQFQLELKRSENIIAREERSDRLIGDERVVKKIEREGRETVSRPSLLSELLSQKLTRLNSEKTSVLYYSQNQAKEAAACAEEIFNKRKLQNLETEFSAVGFSMGGGAVSDFALQLQNRKIKLKSVLTIDPVRRGFSGGKDVVFKTNRAKIKKTSNVDRWVNFYQKSDRSSLHLLGIRGSRVEGADENIEIKDAWTVNASDGHFFTILPKKMHLFVPLHPVVHSRFDELFLSP